jgi:hypothetical protein
VTASAIGRTDGAVPPRERGFLLANIVATLGDDYGAVRHLARLSAIELDRVLETRLAYGLRSFDTQAPGEKREQALLELLPVLQTNANGRLAPPPADAFVSNDYQLDLERIRALLGLQAAQVISVGE